MSKEQLTEEEKRDLEFEKAFKSYKVDNARLNEMKNQTDNLPSYEQEDDIPFSLKPKETNNVNDNVSNPEDDEIEAELRELNKSKNTNQNSINNSNNTDNNGNKNPTNDNSSKVNEEEKPLSRKELQEFFKQQREEELRLKKEAEEKLLKEQEEEKLRKEQEEFLKQSSLNSFDNSKIHNEDEKKRMKEIVSSFGPELEEYVNLRIKEVIEMLKHTEANTKQFANQGLTKAEKSVYDKINSENDFKSQKEFINYIQQKEAEEHYKKVINEIKSEHNDYEPNGELEQKMVNWVNTLSNPKYQNYLASLYQSSDPKDHIMLYDEFKEANNIQKKKPENNKPVEQKKSAQELDAERRRKALSSQSSSRGTDVAESELSFEEKFRRYKVKM